MSGGYPLVLELRGHPCLVVGGGAVAARKAAGLQAAGAVLTVVAPDLAGGLGEGAARGEFVWHRRTFRAEDVRGQRLVVAATADPAVNRAVVAAARAEGAWVNAADAPADGDFHVPATLRRGGVCVAVSSGGASPALAAWVRDRVAAALPPGLEPLAALAGALRERQRSEGGVEGQRFRALFDSGILGDLADGDWEAAERKVTAVFGAPVGVREVVARWGREAP